MAWPTQDIIDWLATLGIGEGLDVDVQVVRGDQAELDTPEPIALVTRIPGVGESLEGIADTDGFQLLIKGEQNDPASSEDLALRADALIRDSFPAPLPGGRHLLLVVRSGGAPAPIGPLAEDDAERTPYVCTYLTTTA